MLSSWVNLQDIFKAQRGEGQRMADEVYGGLEQQASGAKDAINRASRGFAFAAGQSAAKTRGAMSGGTADAAQASGQMRYTGPRTLGEYNPDVSAAVGKAAQAIASSSTEQYQAKYGTSSGAYGGALDRALIARGGGDARRSALMSSYGDLRGQLRGAQANAAALGDKYGGDIEAEALRLAGMVPELRNQEAAAAEARAKAANDARLATFEQEQARRNAGFRRRRGNEIQAAYARDYPGY